MIVRRILILDPDLTIGKMYEERFRARGYIVLYTNSPKSALEFAKALLPDLILLDPDFPAGEGRAFLDEILKTKETAHIPVIVTAEGSLHEEMKKLHQGRLAEEKHGDELIGKVNNYFESMGSLWADSLEQQKKVEAARSVIDETLKEVPKAGEELKFEVEPEPEPSEAQAAPRYRVVLVADDPFFVRLYEAKLAQAGFTASTVPNPDLPYEYISSVKPHVIVAADRFALDVAAHYKGSGGMPSIIAVIPEGEACPADVSENGVCMPKESLNPAMLSAEIDKLMAAKAPV